MTLDDGYLDALTTAAPILAEHGVPATFFVNSERLDEEHEAWHDVVERVLMSSASLPPVLKMRLAGEDIRLEVTTPDERLRALMTLHGALLPMSAEERAEALERLVAWSGLELIPRQDHRVLLGAEVRALSRLPGCSIGSHSARHLLLPGHPAEVQRAELRDCKQTLEALIGQPVRAFCYPFGEHSAALADIVGQTAHAARGHRRPRPRHRLDRPHAPAALRNRELHAGGLRGNHRAGLRGRRCLNGRPRFDLGDASAAGPLRGVSIGPRVIVAWPCARRLAPSSGYRATTTDSCPCSFRPRRSRSGFVDGLTYDVMRNTLIP